MDYIEEHINDNSTITANSTQLEILKQNFPNCFDKEGNFIAHKMEEIVKSSGLALSKESYSLHWLGKSYARLLANENPLTMLKEDKAHNAKEENRNSQNLLIKGDNLEVLKHLKNGYENSIKMIYIDPPYNTGSDGFVYNDDRKFSMEELSNLAGVSLEESKRILEFTTSNSNSHSAWLTFMYPRLYIARTLLKEDGVIFISIDDNEIGQLKLLCDEVFGEENFFAILTRRAMHTVRNSSKDFNVNSDYILVYAKQKEWFSSKKENFIRVIKDKSNNYKLNDDDGKGFYKLDPLNARNYAKSYTYTFDNGITWSAKNGTYPRYSIETLRNKEKNNEIVFSGKEPKAKRYLLQVQEGQPPNVILDPEDVGFNSDGTIELRKLFEEGNIFSQPKNTKLIIFLNKLLRDKSSLILDFFAGSGTTAHAVMDLNKEDGGDRKFITVQLPELIDEKKNKVAYKFVQDELKKEPTIFEITKERILRASQNIKEEISKDLTKESKAYDLGFKIFETAPLLDNPLDSMDSFDENRPNLFDPTLLKEEDFDALLTTWKVHDGMRLSDGLEEVTLKEYKAYYGDKKLYFVHEGFSTEDLKAFILKLDNDTSFEPNKLVVFGYSFESKYQREISEALRSYSNKKSIELDMVVRY